MGPLPINVWSSLSLDVDLPGGTITAILDGATSVTAPIALSGIVDPTMVRFCYRGEGPGNVATTLFDNLRFEFGAASSEAVVLGTPPQPNQLRVGGSSGPVLGQVWDPFVDTFVPGAVLDSLFISLGGATPNQPTPFGDLLVSNFTLLNLTVPAGQPFLIPIPVLLQISGLPITAQAIEAGSGGLALTNAIEATIGF